ncbi:hypothetical protein FA95DRAFT_1605043 [Auriscalpium vulgare]|uniref:Uncharacterized protein n=1 Tax=Auriscalpium vulgare TaxID=40419 RepID=A0ACB8RWR4_9AGAM|nr:hypothetical protein FA95DRAFT_1605043 [Auriscalpium vulgare]
MFNFRVLAFIAVLAQYVLFVQGLPVQSRQIGDLQCNIDRLKIVTTLEGAKITVDGLAASLSKSADASNIKAVANNIAGAQGGIGVIGKALLTGQAAPASARTQVQDNLTQAIKTLANIKSSDAGIASRLKLAAQQLNNSAADGDGVVSNCK